MLWDRSHRSPDLEDRRAQGGFGGGGGRGLGGLLGLLPLIGRFGWRGILIVGAIVAALYYTGQCGLGGGGSAGGGAGDGVGGAAPAATLPGENAGEDELLAFVGFVFDDAQRTFSDELASRGKRYERAKIVIFRDGARTACGTASSDTGPFYCPNDREVYIDLSFYRELRQRFGAPGDFAQAYVIAHEVGHHVQQLLGGLASDSSVEVELQADCLAGIWANAAEGRDLLEAGDLIEALDAAAAIGDDAIQQKTEGRIRPERWTHGSSAQRQRSFQKGHDGGTLAACGL